MYFVLNAPFTAARSWIAPSLFFTVIGVPAVTVNLLGTNLNPLIVTDVTGAVAVAAPAVPTPTPPVATISSSVMAVTTSRVTSGRLEGFGMLRASRLPPDGFSTGGG